MLGERLKGLTATIKYDTTERIYTATSPTINFFDWYPNSYGTVWIDLDGDDRSPNRSLYLSIGQDFLFEIIEKWISAVVSAPDNIAKDVRAKIHSINDEPRDQDEMASDLVDDLKDANLERRNHQKHKIKIRAELQRMIDALDAS